MFRRIFICFICLVIIVLGITSCSGKQDDGTEALSETVPSENTDPVTESQTETDPPAPVIDDSDLEIQIFQPDGAGSTTLSFTHDVDGIPDAYRVDSDTELKAEYPVYYYEYSMGQLGPLWDIGDDDISAMRDNLRSFLKLIDSETEVSDDEIEYWDAGFHVVYSGEQYDLRASRSAVKIVLNDMEIPYDELLENIDSNDFVKACLEYAGIAYPEAVKYTETSSEGERYYSYIFDGSENPLEAEGIPIFRSITIYGYEGVVSSIGATRQTMTKELGKYKTVPLEKVLSELKEKYPELDTDNVKAYADYYYSLDWLEGGGEYGCYVPCYTLYIGSTDEAEDMYCKFDVAMTEFDIDAVEIKKD